MQAQFIDDVLSQAGEGMCSNAYQNIEDLTLHSKVFVSPFRRTIQSACHLLKNHPNKSSLTLIVSPGATEHLGFKNMTLQHAEALKAFCANMS